jgi:hypothetical protein
MSTTSRNRWWQFDVTRGRRREQSKRRQAARRNTPLRVEHLESRCLLAAIPADGLVSWYRAENDAMDFADGNHGVLQNGTTFATGKVGQAFSFDGDNDFIRAPDSPDWAFGSSDFTIELWVNFNSLGVRDEFVANDEGAGDNNKWIFWRNGGQLQFHLESPTIGPPALSIGSTLFSPVPGTWHHVAVTRDDNTYTFYVDGVAGTPVTDVTPVPDANAPLTIGEAEGGSPINGRIDELAIYRRSLSAAEIASIVSAGSEGKATIVVDTTADIVSDADSVTSLREAIEASNSRPGRDAIGFDIPRPSTDELVSWWRGEGNPNDEVGTNHGTLQNGATFTVGQYGQAFDLDGVDDFVQFPDAANLDGMSQLTVDAWVKFDALPSGKWQWIVSKGSAVGVGSNSYSIWLAGDSMRLTAAIETGGGLLTLAAPEVFTDTTGFHHVVLTYDGARAKFFVDGTLKSSAALSGSILNTNFPVFIGRRSGTGVDGNGDVLNGIVDEVGVFDRALTDAQIQALAAGQRTISPTSALPTITDPVIIDGYTQPGAIENSVSSGFNGKLAVELSGANAGAAVGLDVVAGASTIRGLVINRFAQEAIVLRTGGGNIVEGNELGTDFTGNVALANRGGIIVYAGSGANMVGGAAPAARNIISGNLWNGIEINGFGGGTAGNNVQGNYIGTNAAGTSPLGNGIHGVYILNASNNTVGGPGASAAHRIAFNVGAGVKVEGASTGNAVLGSSVFANTGLGIDLDNNGVAPNDPLDGDGGPNNLQNFPVLTNVVSSGGSTTIDGTLNSLANTQFRVELFVSSSADPSGHGEGEVFLGFVNVTTNAVGDAAFSFTTPTPVGTNFTATAARLDTSGNVVETSEFSAAVTEQAVPATIQFQSATYQVIEGEPFAILRVERTGNLAAGARVDFETVDGTAGQARVRAGLTRVEDFTTTSGTLFFRSRQNLAEIRIPIRDDASIEGDERFRVLLSNPSAGFDLGAIATADVVIHDNDPSLVFVEASSQRGEGVGGRATIEVQLRPAASNKTITVNYAAVSGSATAGQDFTPGSGRLTFRPGETRKFINYATINDTAYEGSETVTFELSSPTNAFLGTQTRHRVTLLDNDPQPPPQEPGSTPATALFIDLQTLPRQSFHDVVARVGNSNAGDIDTFRVHLSANEAVVLDVDPEAISGFFPGIVKSTMTVFAPDDTTPLARVGRSAEPDTGVFSDNPALLFRAPAAGDYYFQLQTGINGIFGYRLHFHRLGVSENVPSPDLLKAGGSMYAWFNGTDTVGITGPTGYGFTLEGPWQQTTVFNRRNGLTSQTLRLPFDSHFKLKSPQGVELPLIANGSVVIHTTANRFGNVVGVVDTSNKNNAIWFPVAIDIVPLNQILANVFGSNFATVGLLAGEWRISLGGTVYNLPGTIFDDTERIDQLMPGVPYLRRFGNALVDTRLGGLSLNYDNVPVHWVFDPADPMLLVKVPQVPQDPKTAGPLKKAALGASMHGLLRFKPQDAPDPAIDAGVTEFAGHYYATAKVALKVGPVPVTIEADQVVNIDADRDGKLLGDLGDVADVFSILQGDFSEIREILDDIQFGANGSAIVEIPKKQTGEGTKMEAGRASLVLNGLTETAWIRGQQGGKAFPGAPIEVGGASIVMEGLIDFSGEYFIGLTTSYSAGGIDFAYKFTISNEGITARITGRVGWDVQIDYGVGKVSGRAIAEIDALVAIEIDGDEVHLSGSISASGKLKYNGDTLFTGSISSSVRSHGFRFRFPRGVGEINLNLF